MTYDIAIIGGGPAGYSAAITAGNLGAKTILFEKNQLGGICLNLGCIPTKAILKSAVHYRTAKELSVHGIKTENTTFNLSEINNHAKDIISRLNKGIEFLLNKANVEIVRNNAEIISPHTIKSENREFECQNIIITTGTRPKKIFETAENEKDFMTYKEALFPESIPEELAIIGSGAIGMEFAEIYSSFGSKITIIEKESRILPSEEKDISDLLKRILTKRGYIFHTATQVASFHKENKKIILELDNGKMVGCDKVLTATGVIGNIENIGLENIGIKTVNGYIETDRHFATSVKNVFAVGDIAGPPFLAHKAMHDAKNCVKMILGKKYTYTDRNLIPSCLYTTPQVASFGIKTNKFNKQIFTTNGKALCDGATDGFIKTYLDEKGKIAGVAMIGENVTELIGCFLTMACDNVNDIIMPHPTLSESITDSITDGLPL